MSASVTRLREHLRESAPRYYPELAGAPPGIELQDTRASAFSVVYRFLLRGGSIERPLVVKLPLGGSEAPTREPCRPRVAPLLDRESKFQSEHDALRAIERHFTALADARFGAVRSLDFLPREGAIVMETCAGTPLRSLLAGSHRLHLRSGAALDPVFRDVGAWLNAYNRITPLPHTRTRNATRAELVASIRHLADFLASAHGNPDFFATLVSTAESGARAWLPESLPLGMGHGDLAPRNVLVEGRGRVTLIDTRAAWRTPVYEDLAYFLSSVRTSRVQALSLGLAFDRATLDRYEGAFLRGYFGEREIPRRCIRLFELQALLDKWASSTEARRGNGAPECPARLNTWASDRLLRRELTVAGRWIESRCR